MFAPVGETVSRRICAIGLGWNTATEGTRSGSDLIRLCCLRAQVHREVKINPDVAGARCADVIVTSRQHTVDMAGLVE